LPLVSNITEIGNKIYGERNWTDFIDFKDSRFSIKKGWSNCFEGTYIKFTTKGK